MGSHRCPSYCRNHSGGDSVALDTTSLSPAICWNFGVVPKNTECYRDVNLILFSGFLTPPFTTKVNRPLNFSSVARESGFKSEDPGSSPLVRLGEEQSCYTHEKNIPKKLVSAIDGIYCMLYRQEYIMNSVLKPKYECFIQTFHFNAELRL